VSSLPATVPAADLALLEALGDRVRGHLAASRSAATRRAYASDWADFGTWCAGAGVEALPATPEAVALYLTALADAGANASSHPRSGG
jgi:hypothetical protein